jgi:hypothetical protein
MVIFYLLTRFYLLTWSRLGSCQAAGSCRENDGGLLVNGVFEGIEIKGCSGRGATQTTFSFKDIRLDGARWRHLFLVGRVYQPSSWLTVADVEPAIWLGYVTRVSYIAALDADGRPHHEPQDATMTPGSNRSWLSKAVNWTKLEDLSLAWWQRNVGCVK